MMIKQKIAILVVAFGLMVGLAGVLPGSMVAAQQTAQDCQEDPAQCDANLQSEGNCDPNKDKTCCGKVKTSIITGEFFCSNNTSANTDAKDSAIWKLLIAALKIMTAGIGIAAVGGIVYGALLYTTAEDKPEQTKRAISIITNVVIGLVAYGLMYVFLNYLIPGGIFNKP